MNGHYVYKYIFNNEVIYIGKNNTDLISRINQHKSEEKFLPYLSSDIYYICLNNEFDTDFMETLLINKYKPMLNISKKNNFELGINFVEPEWKRFYEQDFKTIKVQNHKKRKVKNTSNNTESTKSKKKLEFMLKQLSYYQDIHRCNIKTINGKSYIKLPYDLDNIPTNFSIPTILYTECDEELLCNKLFKRCRPDKELKTAIFELNFEGYKIFQDNFDLIIKQYNESIIKFAKGKGLNYDT